MKKYYEIVDAQGGVICWKYISLLYKIQSTQTFHLANRLTLDHINFENQIMKVFLAAQVISLSVANGIDHCRVSLKLPDFKDSEPTSKFLRTFNELFDLLNSSSKFGTWSKAPLSASNTGYWRDVFREGAVYIKGLKLMSGSVNYR